MDILARKSSTDLMSAVSQREGSLLPPQLPDRCLWEGQRENWVPVRWQTSAPVFPSIVCGCDTGCDVPEGQALAGHCVSSSSQHFGAGQHVCDQDTGHS